MLTIAVTSLSIPLAAARPQLLCKRRHPSKHTVGLRDHVGSLNEAGSRRSGAHGVRHEPSPPPRVDCQQLLQMPWRFVLVVLT